MEESNQVELQSTQTDSTDVTVKNFKVTKKKSVRIKNEGIATDFVNASVEGKEIAKNRKKELYKSDDSVDEMETATANLLADSSRKVISKMEEEENSRLNELLSKTYSPRTKSKSISERKMVEAILNIV
jgi:hypothetical protein